MAKSANACLAASVSFFEALRGFDHGQSIGDGITMSEWTFDLATDNGPVLWNEVLRRRWQNGKVISERYYTAARN